LAGTIELSAGAILVNELLAATASCAEAWVGETTSLLRRQARNMEQP
jgi:hypothetical protein